MVSSRYLVNKPAPQSHLKRFFEQRIMPAAIDRAACLDMGLVKTGERMRRNPAMVLGLAVGMGVLLATGSDREGHERCERCSSA